jgi:hypothetical protein
MKNCLIRLILAGICLIGGTLGAAPLVLAAGDVIPEITAADQQGKAFSTTNGCQFLLIATEMNAAKAANAKLAEQGAGFLEKHQAAYLLDIHTMPGIARLFAFPKMRKDPERIILVDTAKTLSVFPAQPGRVTVVALTPDRHIQKISFWDPVSEPVAGCF